VSKATAGGSFGSRPRATLPSVKTIFALIALLLPAGGSVALADEPAAPAAPEAIVAYHDSGEWAEDTTQVVRRARRYIRRHLDDSSRRAAIVLDIDDTSLSNYECLKDVGFDRSSADCADQTLPAIAQTRSLFRWAREKGVTVFFVTGRREEARQQTAANLRAADYRSGWTLKMRPDGQSRRWRDGWKARVRRAIVQRRDFRILANLGDQWSDLDGGWSVRRFKLPNPMYVIPTA
jgi:predicted secreted acid phosphatase